VKALRSVPSGNQCRLCFNALGCANDGTAPVPVLQPLFKEAMNATKLMGILLIVAGTLGLAYGSFSYTRDTTAVKLGPLELSVKEKETVSVPVWAGVGAIVVGGLLLLRGGKRR
jgi:hypothetical protein